MKKIICLMICLISVFALFGCNKEESSVLDKILEKGEIVIVTSPDYPPFEFIDTTKTGTNQYVGADVELMKYIAKELGVTLKIETADFDTTLAFVQTGVADLAISGYTYKAERAENYEMSNKYDSEGKQGVLVLAENSETYGTLAKINVSGNKVAAQNGSLQYSYVESYLENSTIEPVVAIADGVQLLKSKAVVAMAISSTTAESIIAQNPNVFCFLEETFDVPEEETELYALAQKGQTELIAKINEIIADVLEQNLYSTWKEEAKALAQELGQ